MRVTEIAVYNEAAPLPGIRSRFVKNINGLTMHMLEAGFEGRDRPCVLLLHGFPELAYSWRKVMLPIASAGFHVVAPDQRGYGRTTGWDGGYDGDLGSFGILNLVRDTLALVSALGYRSVAAVVGDVTWVITDEVNNGHWGVGGNVLGLNEVKRIMAGGQDEKH